MTTVNKSGAFVITTAALVKAAREAFEAGDLSAQGPTPECKYRDASGRPCAIGAVLSDEVVAEGQIEGRYVSELTSVDGVVLEDADYAQQLQAEHDAWATRVRQGDDAAFVAEARQAFLRVLEEGERYVREYDDCGGR